MCARSSHRGPKAEVAPAIEPEKDDDEAWITRRIGASARKTRCGREETRDEQVAREERT
jgi:hypothetical protein